MIKGLPIGSFITAIFICSTLPSCAPSITSDQSSKLEQISKNDSATKWFEGGDLHKATVGKWKSASYENKLATCGDWLTSTKWKNRLNSPQDIEKLKTKAAIFVSGLDKAVVANNIDHLVISEIAATLLVMSNDLDPDR